MKRLLLPMLVAVGCSVIAAPAKAQSSGTFIPGGNCSNQYRYVYDASRRKSVMRMVPVCTPRIRKSNGTPSSIWRRPIKVKPYPVTQPAPPPQWYKNYRNQQEAIYRSMCFSGSPIQQMVFQMQKNRCFPKTSGNVIAPKRIAPTITSKEIQRIQLRIQEAKRDIEQTIADLKEKY